MNPAFMATISLYETGKGGRQHPIAGEWFSCPCKFYLNDHSAWDCRVLLKGAQLSPGETAEFGLIFLNAEAGKLFSVVPAFYLWEGRIIGEARPLKSEISN